jgi:putative flippase GtrA
MTCVRRQCARFGKFGLTGVIGAAVQMILFDFLMKRFHLPGVAAAPIAVELVVLNNFCWHACFTWRDRGAVGPREIAARLWRFHAGNGLLSLAGNTVLMYCLVQELKAPAMPSAVAAIAVCAPLNFLVADRWVFRR